MASCAKLRWQFHLSVCCLLFCFMFMPPKQLIKCKLDEHVRRDARPGCAANIAHDLRNVQRQKIIENYQDKARNFTTAKWPIVMLMRRSHKPKEDMAKTSQRMAKRVFISIAKNQEAFEPIFLH